jgi:endonuclease-8
MPEGDTIFRAATVLRRALAGERVRRLAVPRLLIDEREPATSVRTVEARGKHLLVRFDDGRVLHTHLGMSGSWYVDAPDRRRPRADHAVRALVEVPRATAICFDAPTVEILSERDLGRHPRLAALGPDLCADEPDLEDVLARLARLPGDTPIGVALLDQRVASGVGNVYKSETLFACRIDPWSPVGALDEATRRSLYATASGLLRRNLGGGPRVTAPGGVAVYRRAGRPCPRCGTTIVSARQGEAARNTYRCPSCQPAANERRVGGSAAVDASA